MNCCGSEPLFSAWRDWQESSDRLWPHVACVPRGNMRNLHCFGCRTSDCGFWRKKFTCPHLTPGSVIFARSMHQLSGRFRVSASIPNRNKSRPRIFACISPQIMLFSERVPRKSLRDEWANCQNSALHSHPLFLLTTRRGRIWRKRSLSIIKHSS